MKGVLIIAAALLIVGTLLWLHDRHTRKQHPADEPQPIPMPEADPETGCCGQHSVCERDSLLAAVSSQVDYFDDEELDAYAGRDPETYNNDEIEQFRDVLLTLLPQDVAPWARSIQLRGIQLPTPVRDELLLIVDESRTSAS